MQCHECEGYGHFRNESPLAKRKELNCIECKGYGHTQSECPNNLKKDKSMVGFSDTESENNSDGKDMHLNFMALIGQEEESKPDTKTETIDEKNEDDLNHDLETEYKTMFNKFAELSHENLQLLKDKAMLKAQVNILELDKPASKEAMSSLLKESDQEVLSIKRTMIEQERVQKLLESKVTHLSDLLEKEIDKNKLLESQLTENHKKVRMLTSGTSTLDHLLTIGQCPSTNRGLGFQGSTSKSGNHVGKSVFVKEVSNGVESTKVEKTKTINIDTEVERKPVITHRGNVCHFCGKRGHHVKFCYLRQHQYQRAWRMNMCFVEPSSYGHVWIAKRDLYPNYNEQTQDVSQGKTHVPHISVE
ncbi:hypothetical protein N665_0098s0050 [Sinapis alba]|nr:hypothetical protein N665_0098s0050 [Sinapis alba]